MQFPSPSSYLNIIEEFTDFNKVPSKLLILKCAEFCVNPDIQSELLNAAKIDSEL